MFSFIPYLPYSEIGSAVLFIFDKVKQFSFRNFLNNIITKIFIFVKADEGNRNHISYLEDRCTNHYTTSTYLIAIIGFEPIPTGYVPVTLSDAYILHSHSCSDKYICAINSSYYSISKLYCKFRLSESNTYHWVTKPGY